MEANSDSANEEIPVSFDLLEGFDLSNDSESVQDLTEEQREALNRFMDTLNTGDPQQKDNDYEAFQQNAVSMRHAICTEEDLDDISDQNSTDTTKWQTKWAVNVYKGNLTHISVKNLAQQVK